MRDPEKKKASNRAWYERNTAHAKAQSKKWREDNLDRDRLVRRAHHLMTKYGITVEQYEEMLLAQNGQCAICGKLPGKLGLHVDHCHKTGKVRKLLCSGCNGGLGHLENEAWMILARKYLDENA